MRVLGIETSSRRGSVALLEQGRVIEIAEHDLPNAHAEQVLALIEAALGRAGWSRTTLDLLGVGVGPGSFVGLRVGIALMEGISLGIGRPTVGVPSLLAMARAIDPNERGLRVPLLDARRSEVFMAAYDEAGHEQLAPCAVASSEVCSVIARLSAPALILGEVAQRLELPDARRSAETDLPHARWVATLASELGADDWPPTPIYVRDAGAALPTLPTSPFLREP
ncbi:MAG TPA: tRNA (adenosine(37)-N6)-threonylcarbamoyltransferase complex dimerization subunit type 1 TsaB [Polyangiaceae bacterium]|nr:tRNA (adenosine(37)-N6)-threonylcarbamoyltransferase complex dimerization subunit type 1 TsaB [Polyangiaceae bacterium]